MTCFGPPTGTDCSASAGYDTNSGYDGLNRPTVKRYSDGTPTVSYVYDTDKTIAGHSAESNYPHGRLVSVSNANSESVYRYDVLGRTQSSQQTTSSTHYVFGYAYNSVGLTSLTYPSGRAVTYDYDNAGRVKTVTGGSGTYAQGPAGSSPQVIQYAPQGAIQQMQLGGSGLVEAWSYNSRLQAQQIQVTAGGNSLWKLENFFCGTPDQTCRSNNGNVTAQRQTVPLTTGVNSSWTTVYGYDRVNRLTLAVESPTDVSAPVCPDAGSAWCQQYGYGGQYGNITVTDPKGVTPAGLSCGSYSATTNRCTGAGFQYDNGAANGPGNLTAAAGRSMTYDAENRQISLVDVSTSQYLYDGEGRRVQKVSGSQATTYVYDAMGQLAAEYGGTTADGLNCATCFVTVDHLGSTRLMTDATASWVRRYDYVPFGWDINGSFGQRPSVAGYVMADSLNPKFTGKTRDYESGLRLDYFGARYFSGAQGRFTGADPIFFQKEMLNDPQRFNLYAYARNNPLRFVDPSGERIELVGTEQERANLLEDIKYAVGGGDAADRLRIVQEGRHYYVDAGDLTSFGQISRAASEWTSLLSRETENVIYAYATKGTGLPTPRDEDPNKLFYLAMIPARGVTYRDLDGNLRVYVQHRAQSMENESGLDFDYFTFRSKFVGSLFGVEANTNTVAAHEFGHARYEMMVGPGHVGFSFAASSESALELENIARKAHDPNAPMRVRH